MATPTRIPLLFGTMTLGFPGKNGVRISDREECQKVIDVFLNHGHKELDTARVYGDGTTEEMMSQLDLKDAVIDTKVHPGSGGGHSPQALRSAFETSLKSLGRKKVRVLYLHMPDRTVPFEETVEEINKLYEEGLLGGFFAGKVSSLSESASVEGRFNPKGDALSQMYRARYLKSGYLDALELLKGVANAHGLRLTEIALRWCQHHSLLTPEDGIILGASSAEQLQQNCEDSKKGPLPDEVIRALDEANRLVIASGSSPRYWR
ncbi:hypothetical protein VNI00_003398 [Paramarasmius palmivorus]|uniref:NADP-dependent oxidoreductase domain-containing protein n=1 Tax=Paramarasmius palmivorus TaxID=297713 RepID=A0AAW0DS16_9AGAR